ncbi:MAG: cryptochrome/photolyase family protein [Thermaurantiacus sp.]
MAAPHIIWFRQDLRLADQAAVAAAAEAGPIIPVFVLDDVSKGLRPMGAASRWWLHHSLVHLDASLRQHRSRLLLLKGASSQVLLDLARVSGADAIHATAHAEPWWAAIEERLGARLKLHGATRMLRPGQVLSGSRTPYRVFTPFWKASLDHLPPAVPKPLPTGITTADMPEGERLEDWGLLPRDPDWATGFGDWEPGEAGAEAALEAFLPHLKAYERRRNFPSEPGTSRLSPHLHFGEISPATVWHAAEAAVGPEAAQPFTRQLVWREFAHELLEQYPDGHLRPHRPEFARMEWTDTSKGDGRRWLKAWQRGRTGYPIVDAGMRQLWQTGWMHNRVRMITASFLTKHLRIDWREGERWFWDTLVDADLANNAMGWQWVMGSGVDSQPYYRIFAPVAQSEKFDALDYIREFAPEYESHQPVNPIVDHKAARTAALAAFERVKKGS